MAKCFIIFGTINKKLILPLVACLVKIISSVVNLYDNRNRNYNLNNTFLYWLIVSISQMLVRLYPLIFKIKNEQKQNVNLTKKKKFLHYFLLCLIFFPMIILGFFNSESRIRVFSSQKLNNLFPNNNPITVCFEMILLICLSIFFLKYKYYKHHIISLMALLLIAIFSFVSRFNYYLSQHYSIFIHIIAHIILDAIYRCYQKYMMEKFYYPYWNIAFVPGVILFPMALVLSYFHLTSFYKRFINSIKHFIIFDIVFPLVFNVIMCPLTILIVYYFSPDYILIITLISSITETIIYAVEFHGIDYSSIPMHIIQIFFMLVYLEIIELNFCGLNNNTRRNIHLRGELDSILVQRETISEVDNFDTNKNYSIELEEKFNEDIKTEEEKLDEKFIS